MAAKTTVHTPGNQSLMNFQTVVQQQEGIFGPLKALRQEDQNNAITLEIDHCPTNRALLETYDSSAPPNKPDHRLICVGECLVSGQPAKVAAYRRT
jgi:hypothetical protein